MYVPSIERNELMSTYSFFFADVVVSLEKETATVDYDNRSDLNWTKRSIGQKIESFNKKFNVPEAHEEEDDERAKAGSESPAKINSSDPELGKMADIDDTERLVYFRTPGGQKKSNVRRGHMVIELPGGQNNDT